MNLIIIRCVCILRYTYGKPVVGHLNLTFIHHFRGIDDVYSEDRMVCSCAEATRSSTITIKSKFIHLLAAESK